MSERQSLGLWRGKHEVWLLSGDRIGVGVEVDGVAFEPVRFEFRQDFANWLTRRGVSLRESYKED